MAFKTLSERVAEAIAARTSKQPQAETATSRVQTPRERDIENLRDDAEAQERFRREDEHRQEAARSHAAELVRQAQAQEKTGGHDSPDEKRYVARLIENYNRKPKTVKQRFPGAAMKQLREMKRPGRS